ncbi:hypothetical protein AVEN_235256-1 [Araneus ventricosus]|uniref:Uncharacterized protein n=1 Tax=Araneus ventricosus TaxID=182803 RepID=A0A4Y2A4G3_ARAVE|nr:hypothetical protein AVEN_235256-1 [Araneus ventricosus]
MLISRFEATRRLFWDGPHNFQPLQMPKTTPELAPSCPNFRTTWRTFGPTYDLMCNTPTYIADIQWNRISNPPARTQRPYHYSTTASRVLYYTVIHSYGMEAGGF